MSTMVGGWLNDSKENKSYYFSIFDVIFSAMATTLSKRNKEGKANYIKCKNCTYILFIIRLEDAKKILA
jgi:hypothetical protein